MRNSFILAASAVGTLAAPAQSNAKFSVELQNTGEVRHIFYELRHIGRRYQHGYGKEQEDHWNSLIHPKVKSRQASGTVIASPGPNGSDREYLAPVQIGTPAQTVNLDFDTGSSDLWVFSSDTNEDEVNGQTLYKPKDSSTAEKQEGSTWKIGYADESGSSGIVYNDVVSIGGLSVPNQAVESAQEVSDQFTNDTTSSGLLGLGYDAGNTVSPTKQKTWFSNIGPKLAKNLFTARLRHAAKGSYNFGYIDDSQYTGKITYTTAYADSRGHRLFNSTGFGTGSGRLANPVPAIADTGSSILAVPNAVAKAYWSNVSGAQRIDQKGQHIWVFSCNTKLPDFTVGVGSSKVVVPGSYINYAKANDAGQYCIGGISSLDGYDDLAILGDVFLKPNFVVYDDANSRIGFAKGA